MNPMRSAFRTSIRSLLQSLGINNLSKPGSGRHAYTTFDRNALTWQFDRDRYWQLYQEGMRRSGTGPADSFGKQTRFYALMQMVEYAMSLDSGADVAECGCWKGHSTFVIATLIRDRNFQGRLHVFDSFEGLSALGPEDRSAYFPLTPPQVSRFRAAFAATELDVTRVLEGFDFVRLYKGWIPSRFSEVADRRFSFVHIDVDLYAPVRESLDFFYPRVIEGGAIVIDDYGLARFPGAKRATDEFLAREPPHLFFAVPTGGAFIVK
jgi:hypothetical protein